MIEVITGGMFAGKTEELIRRLRRAKIAGQRVLVIYHAADTRSTPSTIESHDKYTFAARPVGSLDEIVETIALAMDDDRPIDVLGIDEAQFFGLSKKYSYDLAHLCRIVLRDKSVRRIIVAGPAMDFTRLPLRVIVEITATLAVATKPLSGRRPGC